MLSCNETMVAEVMDSSSLLMTGMTVAMIRPERMVPVGRIDCLDGRLILYKCASPRVHK